MPSGRALAIPDTLLPTQTLEVGGVVYSRLSDSNFAKGIQLRLLQDRNLVLNKKDLATGFAYVAYYVSGTNNAANSTNAGFRVMHEESGYVYILIKNGLRFDLTPADKLVSAKE